MLSFMIYDVTIRYFDILLSLLYYKVRILIRYLKICFGNESLYICVEIHVINCLLLLYVSMNLKIFLFSM
jgi:hypothetical protein